jgi:hypothetical protein
MPNFIEDDGNLDIGFGQAQKYGRAKPINTAHGDKQITFLSDTDISFGLFKLFTYFDKPFGWYW